MALLDQYGRQIKGNKPILEEIAVQTVRERYSSYPSHGLTPERLATIMKEADQGDIFRQAELFEEMEEKDIDLGGDLQTRKLAIIGLGWEILPASDSPEDKKIAEAAKEMIEYIENWEDALLDILDAIGKGFSVSEIMWEISEGQVWITELKWIHQKRFTFSGPTDPSGKMGFPPLLNIPRLITDEQPVYGAELIPNKFVFHRYKARSGATSRGGLCRPCSYMYLFKNYDIKDWLIFNELYAVPMRIGKYTPGAGKDEIEVLKKAVFNLGTDAAAVISDNTIIELLESKVRGETSAFKDLAEFCKKSISKSVLGHTGSSESTPGKLGGEDQAQEVRQDLLEADAKALMRAIKFQILAPWCAFSFGPDKGVPIFNLHFEAEENLKEIAETYGILVRDVNFKGIPVKHVHERFGIPMPVEGEETVSAAPVSSVIPDSIRDPEILKQVQDDKNKEFANKGFAEKNEATEQNKDLIDAQNDIDALIENTFKESSIDLSPLKTIIETAESHEDLQKKIKSAYGDLSLKDFREVLERALFVAELKGRSIA
jgi:phage gp29-like protein